MNRFIAFGELLLRLDTPGHERFVQAGQFTARYTGGEANVAASLAQWGVQTFAVSKVPDHEMGQACINYLRAVGINTDHVVRGGARLGILYVEVGASQRPYKVIYDREHSSFRDIRRGEVDWKAILRGGGWLHFTGTAPALGPKVLAVLKDGLRAVRKAGVTVSFDFSFRSALWSAKKARAVVVPLMEHVDVFIGSHHDAKMLFGIEGAPEHSAAQLRDRLGFRCVAYTLRDGASASINRLGGLLCDASGSCISRCYDMQMVDRIGGGDAFAAGVIYGLMSGWNGERTIEFAAAASCLKHSIPGDFNLASIQEIEELAATGKAGRVRR